MLLTILLLGHVWGLLANKVSLKFGDYNPTFLDYSVYPPDSQAEALILLNFGQFYGENIGGVEHMVREYHFRIKILKEDAIEEFANWNLMYYHEGDHKLDGIVACTVNLENGKESKVYLDKNDIFTERLDDKYAKKVVVLPDVKIGSIVEIKYSYVSSLATSSNPFYFQREHPVIRAEFRFQNPNYVSFTSINSGLLSKEVTQKKASQLVGHMNEDRDREIILYRIDSLEGMHNDEMIYAPMDYFTQLRFQVHSFNNGAFVETFSTSWDELSKEFSKELKEAIHRANKGELLALLEGEIDASGSPLEKANDIVDYVTKNFVFNGKNSSDLRVNLNQVLLNKEGNSAELNVLMAAMLDAYGIEADPVLLSTRNNGRLIPEYPYRYQFNHVVWLLTNEKEQGVLDARSYLRPDEIIPLDVLGVQGLLIKKSGPKVVVLDARTTNKEQWFFNVELHEDELVGSGKVMLKGYASYTLFDLDSSGVEDWINDQFTDMAVTNLSWKNVKSDLLQIDFKFKNSSQVLKDQQESIITFGQVFKWLEFPIQSSHRVLPIELSFPYSHVVQIKLVGLEDYKVLEHPERRTWQSENGDLVHRMVVDVKDDHLIMLRTCQFKEYLYPASAATSFEQFRSVLDKSNAEPIIVQDQ